MKSNQTNHHSGPLKLLESVVHSTDTQSEAKEYPTSAVAPRNPIPRTSKVKPDAVESSPPTQRHPKTVYRRRIRVTSPDNLVIPSPHETHGSQLGHDGACCSSLQIQLNEAQSNGGPIALRKSTIFPGRVAARNSTSSGARNSTPARKKGRSFRLRRPLRTRRPGRW